MTKVRLSLFVAALVAEFLTSAAYAGVIVSSPAPVVSGPGLGFGNVVTVLTVQSNNDNVPNPNFLDNNITVPLKRFDHTDYIDIEFTVAPSEGVTEYQVSEFVDNNTGVPWSQYNMVLGHGTGAGFVPGPLNDFLDFDFPTYDTPPTSAAFPIVGTPDEDQLVFSGGIHGSGAEPYTFRIDVPDQFSFGGKFTLRQYPTSQQIPEPTAIALAALALTGLVARRRA